jgi:hypothetical protein
MLFKKAVDGERVLGRACAAEAVTENGKPGAVSGEALTLQLALRCEFHYLILQHIIQYNMKHTHAHTHTHTHAHRNGMRQAGA